MTNPIVRTKIVTVEEMVKIEAAANAAGHSYQAMMQQAGHAAADFVQQILNEHRRYPYILLLIGPGNNGGDGLVVARRLRDELPNAHIVMYLLKPREQDPLLKRAVNAGALAINMDDDPDFAKLEYQLEQCTVLVDALFGTGLQLPLRDHVKTLLTTVHETLQQRNTIHISNALLTQPRFPHDKPLIVALDCPSGLDCDSGDVDDDVLPADYTITFAAAKYGHFRFPGAQFVGKLAIGDIGLPTLPEIDDIQTEVASAVGRRPIRNADSHKGTFGKTMIVAGSNAYIGAAYLAAASAYRAGAGLVTCAVPQEIVSPLAAQLPDATWLRVARNPTAALAFLHALEETTYHALLMGPGLGQDDNTGAFLIDVLESHATNDLPPLVLDADALNLLAAIENWREYVPSNTILTPHPREFARLTQHDTAFVLENREALAKRYASVWDCVVVLKGAYTVIANPHGDMWISPIATSALAVAGTGDVLAGLIAGLLAQGSTPTAAAVAAVWLHGVAGLHAAEVIGTTASVMASDVLQQLPYAMQLATSR